jgi:tripartite-type tricarboxylate transporter receptor subunit TctC
MGTNILTVSPALPVKSVKELIALARAQPGKLSYGGIGNGSSQQLSLELLKSMTGTRIEHVAYKAMQQAMTDAIGGQIAIVCENAPSILPHVQSRRLRAVGITGLKRIPIAPEIPTIAEAGVPGYEMAPSSGYMFPARTPRDIVLRMNAEINKALKSQAFTEKVQPAGIEPKGGTPEEFIEHIRRETAKWAAVIKAADIRAD